MVKQVEVWADVVCPWCYIGISNLKSAIDQVSPDGQIELIYRSYELDPLYPRESVVSVTEMLMRKYKVDRAKAEAMESSAGRAAEEAGLKYKAGRPHGNSVQAHRLLQMAIKEGVADQVCSALYELHFAGQGQGSIFDDESLVVLAAANGLDESEVRTMLQGDSFLQQVRDDEEQAYEFGVSGVPFVVADRRIAATGAQPVDAYVQMLNGRS